MFEAFERLNRDWDARVMEGQSLRRAFVLLLVFVFVLGMNIAAALYQLSHHHFDWANFIVLPMLGLLIFRYSRAIYCHLGR